MSIRRWRVKMSKRYYPKYEDKFVSDKIMTQDERDELVNKYKLAYKQGVYTKQERDDLLEAIEYVYKNKVRNVVLSFGEANTDEAWGITWN